MKTRNRSHLPIIHFASKILRSLISILVRHGVSHGEFDALATWLFVDESMRYSESWAGTRTSKARVACVTGLTRKVVDEYWTAASPNGFIDRASPNRAVRAQLGWLYDAQFTDRNGKPLTLPLTVARGPSFHQLVREYSGDIHPRAVLDELLRGNAVELLAEKRVRLISATYLPVKPHEHLALAGISVEDLISTMEHNFAAALNDRYLQHEWYAVDVPAHRVPELRRWISRRVRDFCEAEYLEIKKHENMARRGKKRIGIGAYWFQD